MSNEDYLNHPNFGLLFRVCLIDTARELFTTLYAQRLFFLVANGDEGLEFESITRTDARILVENRMRMLRRQGQQQDYNQLQVIYKQTFQ
ncbi:PipX family protein [Phormidium sp. FACHB-592]|jgi:PII interaction protein X|uniref:PipX family protein n=1 Tax=Stenomitos frigidus AS-A4 TaxID=2933935 RepID=A0ABV0KL93_9CYAN|nr:MULTISPECIES: PipX family protein [Cyanophyceae]MBD2036638.1 PipX family protein [Leptolyngbya sp. FACHB-321]MBD2075270.1 PipX family protein [Phormidium sp. FACHB-592]